MKTKYDNYTSVFSILSIILSITGFAAIHFKQSAVVINFIFFLMLVCTVFGAIFLFFTYRHRS